MRSWQMQSAKAKLAELVKHSADEPQEITSHGQPVAVVVSSEWFEKLSSNASLADLIQASPLHGHEEISFERDKSPTRDAEF